MKFFFPSQRAAWAFARQARDEGFTVRLPGAIDLYPGGTRRLSLALAVAGAVLCGLLGLLTAPPAAEATGTTSFAAVLAVIGSSLGALAGALLGLHRAPSAEAGASLVEAEGERRHLSEIASAWDGRLAPHPQALGAAAADYAPDPALPGAVTRSSWLPWAAGALVAGGLLGGLALGWPQAAGPDRQGKAFDTVRRVEASEPGGVATYLAHQAGLVGLPGDPLAAARLAPVLASGGSTASGGDLGPGFAGTVHLVVGSRVVVIVAASEPAYALPAAYAAAHFRAPILVASRAGLDAATREALAGAAGKRLLVAAPERLIPAGVLADLREYGRVERVAVDDLYRHALLWARGRWGAFGWGSPTGPRNLVLANPQDPAFAAAALALAAAREGGPLIYTGHAALPGPVGAYLAERGRAAGGTARALVIGGPGQVSDEAQAAASLALAGVARGPLAPILLALALAWLAVAASGAAWVRAAIARRVPGAGGRARLYWPLAALLLGPAGVFAFANAYQGRLVDAAWRPLALTVKA